MKRDEQLELFIEKNTEESIKDYLNKIHDNLKDLNSREAKYAFWLIIVLFLDVVLHYIEVNSFQLGYISVNDTTIIIKILPTLFVYFLFNFRVIQSQKRDSEYIITKLSEHLFFPYKDVQKDEMSFITRVFIPYSFTHAMEKVSSKKLNKYESCVTSLILLPIILILLLFPLGVAVYMVIDLFKYYSEDFFGKFSIILAIYVIVLHVYYQLLEYIKSERRASI